VPRPLGRIESSKDVILIVAAAPLSRSKLMLGGDRSDFGGNPAGHVASGMHVRESAGIQR
jgi:hypothetical protein